MTDDDKRELKDAYVSLYTHFNVLMAEREKQMNLRFDAAQVALTMSKTELDHRLATLNKLREDVEKDRSLFVKQEVYNTKTEYYDSWCRSVDKKFAYWGGALAVLTFLLEFIFRYIR